MLCTQTANRSTSQIVIISLTDKYARVVQGTLVYPDPDSALVELRVSVLDTLRYIDDNGDLIPEAWMNILHWTFCRIIEPKESRVDTANGTNTAREEEGVQLALRTMEDAKLSVPKTKDEKTDDALWSGEDEALFQASKSTTALSMADQDEEEKKKKKKRGTIRPSRLPKRTFTYLLNPSTSSDSSSG